MVRKQQVNVHIASNPILCQSIYFGDFRAKLLSQEVLKYTSPCFEWFMLNYSMYAVLQMEMLA